MQIKEEDNICSPIAPPQLMGLRVALFFLQSNLIVTHLKTLTFNFIFNVKLRKNLQE